MGNPNPDDDKQPPIPVIQVPTPRAPSELDLPDELAWQRYRTISTPKKHVVRLSPKAVTSKADHLASVGNLLQAGIVYMVAGLLYAGSPFRSTGERQYLTDTIDQYKAVEQIAKAIDLFNQAEAESYCLLAQECMGVPLMKISADEMNDSVFAWLQEIIRPLSLPVYDACLAFKHGTYFYFRSKPKKAISFFQEYLRLAEAAPDSGPHVPEQQRRLDVDRSQETIRHAEIASDFIFDYARAVKQFLRPKFFAWWLCLASQIQVHYALEIHRKCPSSELTSYLRNIRHLVELLDNCIMQISKVRSPSRTPEHIRRLHEKLLLEFHIEAATVFADAGNTLLQCKMVNDSQTMIENSLIFLQRGSEHALEQEKPDWEVNFRLAQAILQIRLGNLKDAEDQLHVRSKSVRKHPALENMKKLISEIINKGKPKESTKKRVAASIAKTLMIQPLDWYPYDWYMFLGG